MTISEISEVSDFLSPIFPACTLPEFYEKNQLVGPERCRCKITDFTDNTDRSPFEAAGYLKLHRGW